MNSKRAKLATLAASSLVIFQLGGCGITDLIKSLLGSVTQIL